MSGYDLSALFDELEGFFAYETGAVDSGAKNDVRRAEVFKLLGGVPEDELRLGLSRWLRDAYLSEEGLASGYGWEDVQEFLAWFDDRRAR